MKIKDARKMQKDSVKAQIIKYGGKEGYKKEMKRRGILGGRPKKLSTRKV